VAHELAAREAAAAHVVLRLRMRLLPAAEQPHRDRYLKRVARVITLSEAFDALAPSEQLELLLAAFDKLGQGEWARSAAARWAEEWGVSEARTVAVRRA
jgi:hypothetical protein